MDNEIEFVDGLIVKAPHPNAPDFVKGSISIKRKDLGNWLREKDDEWINLDIKEARSGKWYASVNKYKPDAEKPAEKPAEEATGDFDDDVPFMNPYKFTYYCE